MNQILEYIHLHRAQSMVTFVLLLGIVILWNAYCREKRRARKLERAVSGEREFYHGFAMESDSCFLYFRKTDLALVYISPNFQNMTGIKPEAVQADIDILK